MEETLKKESTVLSNTDADEQKNSDSAESIATELEVNEQNLEQEVSKQDEAATEGDESSSEEASDEPIKFFTDDTDDSIVVRIGNFLVIKDKNKEHPYITVTGIQRDWYVGYAPTQPAFVFLDSVLFNELRPSNEDIGGCIMFLVGVFAGSTTFNAKFTDGVIHLINNLDE